MADDEDAIFTDQIELAEEINAKGSSARESYLQRNGRGKRALLVASGAAMIVILLLVVRGCRDAVEEDNRSLQYRATTSTTTQPADVAAAAPTAAPTSTAAPTTSVAPTTTQAATTTTSAAPTTTLAAIAPETLAAFTAASGYHDESLHQIAPDLQVAGLQVYCDEAAQVDGQFIQDLNTTAFSAAVQPLVNTLIGALTAQQQVEQNCAAAQSADAASALYSSQSSADAGQAAIDAEAALRAALGLPPLAG